MTVKIEQFEPQLAQKLEAPVKTILHELQRPIHSHLQLRVSLRKANGGKQRSNSSADNWSPENGILIWFEPSAEFEEESTIPALVPNTSISHGKFDKIGAGIKESNHNVDPVETELLRTLDEAESRPGWSFVPLKKFRDEILAVQNLSAMRTDEQRQNAIRSAIDEKLILVGKVPNPKAPQFPVTTIRLNRLLPRVQNILGKAEPEGRRDLDFHPVEIQGEPLSATILRERR